MFFILALIIFVLTLSTAFAPLWTTFIADGGFKTFWEELKDHTPQLSLSIKTSKKETFITFIKHNISHQARFLTILISFIFIGSFSVYLANGDYNYANQPLIKRLEAKKNQKQQYLLIASMLMDRIQKNSENGKDWKWLAQVLFMAEDYDASIDAFHKAIKFNENDADIYADLGEALVIKQNGKITAEAIRNFMSALRKDRDNLKASYFMALAKWQRNDERKAIAIFKQIIKKADKDNKWAKSSKEHIKEIVSLSGIDTSRIDALDISIIARGFQP
ncbi:MAG: tetratricopeptide repeat protein [Alphaproteobacteria bacterium]